MLTTPPAAPPSTVGSGEDRAPARRRRDVADARRRAPRPAAMTANGTSATAGASRWRTISSPRSTGKLSVRSGWSISCDSGSITSRPSTNSSNAEPSDAPVWCRGHQRPAARRRPRRATTMRTSRAGGKRSRLCQPRRQHRGGRDATVGHAATHGSAAGVLLVQLTAQQDDGAQVLHGDREAQLGDQAAAAGERIERRAAQQDDTRRA